MVEVGLDEAAARLGLSRQRVHQLVHAGDLPARRVAGRWVVDDAQLDRLAEGRSPGRPFSPRVAWGLIGLIESGDAPALSAPERSRLRNRLRHEPSLEELARLARGRSAVHRLHAHPGAVGRAMAWDGAVPTGASAPGHDVVDTRRAEIYLPAATLPALRRALRLRDGDGNDNLVVRVPAVDAWPFPDGKAGPVTVALDLWDAGDARSRRAADVMFRRALAAGRFEAR